MNDVIDAFVPIRSRRAYEEIADKIRERIVSGQLRPGAKLPAERELAVQLGVGRNVVRESMRALEMVGMIEMRRGKWGGAFVTANGQRVVAKQMSDLLRMGAVSYTSVMEARIWLAQVVVKAACERHTDADILALEDNITRVERLFDEGRMAEKTQANIEFHDLLAKATQNPTIEILMRSLTDMAAHFARNIGPDTSSSTVGSRRAFMKALKARKVVAATKEMEASLRRLLVVHVDLAQQRAR